MAKQKYKITFKEEMVYKANSKINLIEKFRVEYPNAEILNIEEVI